MRDLVRRATEWLRTHPQSADTLLAVGVLAVVVTSALLLDAETDAQTRDVDLWWFLLALVTVLPIARRRSEPIAAFVTSVAGLFVLLGFDYPDTGSGFATIVCSYSVAAYADARRSRIVLGAFIPILGVFFFAGWLVGGRGATAANLLANYIVLGSVWLIGQTLRRRRQRLADLEVRNAMLERERMLLARDAVATERAAIARELHDVVAHAVSVMTVQAGAARRIVATRPDKAAEALAVIEETGRQALGELRRVVGVLRDHDPAAERAPQPTLAALVDLVQADPSQPVSLTVEGDAAPLPPSVEVSAYRIVQEALTNVRKHAGTARAEVTLRYQPDALEVEVVDDGRGAAADPAPQGGHGIVGMRERVSLCGGELLVGPRVGGGWRVRARLPRDPAASSSTHAALTTP